MEIRVLIVDNNVISARLIKKVISEFTSRYEIFGIRYSVKKVFKGNNCCAKAKEFISLHPYDFDLLFVDYYLEPGYGTELFDILKRKQRIYKILHSSTISSLEDSKKAYRLGVYDDFAYPIMTLVDKLSNLKSEDAVKTVLHEYELSILNTYLFGNSSMKSIYYLDSGRLKPEMEKLVAGFKFRYFDILYVESTGDDEVKIFFRDSTSTIVDQRKKLRFYLKPFQKEHSNFLFKRVNQSVLINLVWVSSIDIKNGLAAISFIPNTQKTKMPYVVTFEFSGLLYEEIIPFLHLIDSLPTYFK